jgi:hypothetical protein
VREVDRRTAAWEENKVALQPNAEAILDQRHGMVAAGDLSDADMKRRKGAAAGGGQALEGRRTEGTRLTLNIRERFT